MAMDEPLYWDFLRGPKLNDAQIDELKGRRFATRSAFQENVMRRVELSGFAVNGNVASAPPDRAVNFEFSGPDELMNECQALFASMEIVSVLMSGSALDAETTSVAEVTTPQYCTSRTQFLNG